MDGRRRSRDVLEPLDELIPDRGGPQYLRTDNGPEFIAEDLRTWAASQGIGLSVAVIVKRRDSSTDARVALEDALR